MKKNSLRFYVYCCLLVCNQFLGSPAYATGNYQKPSEFIQQVFSGNVPKIKYWRKDARTAWILEEIGKERPITAGIVINDSRIESINVLTFRESRGWEVRYPFFTDQFSDATLKENNQLDRHIDGISGATLSVKAMTKMARLALVLHEEIEIKQMENVAK
jgi:hypothetical protein